MNRKNIIITSGDPSGCGPIIILKAIEQLHPNNINFFVVGDKAVFEKLGDYKKLKDQINFIDAGTRGIEGLKKGRVSKLGGYAGLNYLKRALKIMEEKNIKHLVTAPLSKEALRLVCKDFIGHTEYLASYFKVRRVAMMMTSNSIKTILLTRHIPLRKVPFALCKEEINNTVSLVYSSLKRQFKIKNPKIVLASVNPHAGVNTFLEREEKKLIEATLEFRKNIYGPYPADTLFTKENLKKYNCIICAYHDQAMIPFKLLALRQGVNLTLGLPIIRTSPAHGVAYDAMKKGNIPFHSSMLAAIKLALQLSP